MAPTHVFLTFAGVMFNLANGMAIGGWLGGHGLGRFSRNVGWEWVVPGSLLWAVGLAGNIYHEEVLRNIRKRGEEEKEEEAGGKKGGKVKRVKKAKKEVKGEVVELDGRRYEVPVGGGFEWVWFPHVSCYNFWMMEYGPANESAVSE